MYHRYSFATGKQRVARAPARSPVGKKSLLGDSINSPTFPHQNVVYGNLSGVGLDFSTVLNTATGALKTTAETVLPAYMQYKVFSENLKRSRTGADPLDPNSYAPSMRVQVEPDANTLRTAGGIGIGVIALGALAVFLLLRKR